VKQWARSLRRRHPDVPAMVLVGAVANRAAAQVAREAGCRPVVMAAGRGPDLGSEPRPPDGWADPWLVGVVHEVAASAADRRARGAWYTPRAVVEALTTLALDGDRFDGDGGAGSAPPLVVDPTCGGGAFLLAALDQLVAAGASPEEALGRVAGLDLDPHAVEVSRWALGLWWLGHHPEVAPPAMPVRHGDALVDQAPGWRRPVVVVGNPPFASPLKAGVIPASASHFRAERADLLGPYADLAAIHLLRAVEQAGPGSTVALVQPQSVLAGRDTEGLRAHLDRVAPLRALWAAREPVFDAGVRVCAVVLAVGGEPAPTVTIARGPRADHVGRRPRGRWGELAADALGAPLLRPLHGRCLGELATATAGFRDEHYALVAACREAAPGEDADGQTTAQLVTVGALDPLWNGWSTERIRAGGRDRLHPLVDRSALPPKVQGWLDRQLRPKVLLATQTRLLEPCIDRAGVVAPATPMIAVHTVPEQLDLVAAVLLAPPVVVWAWRRWFGTAMAIDAVKLAARQVAALPLPVDDGAWAEAAALVGSVGDGATREEALAVAVAVARRMTTAYGAADEVFEWWLDRCATTRRR
jgi:N-6 DNA Methylase